MEIGFDGIVLTIRRGKKIIFLWPTGDGYVATITTKIKGGSRVDHYPVRDLNNPRTLESFLNYVQIELTKG